ITLKQMLSHYARLKAWIPFYRHTFNAAKTGISSDYYSEIPGKDFTVKVAENLYMRQDYMDTIFKTIRESDLTPQTGYLYSDLPFYILKEYLEREFHKPLEQIVQDEYYESLGANFMTYLPLEKFSKESIPPTEQDDVFRKQKVQGYVHDQG